MILRSGTVLVLALALSGCGIPQRLGFNNAEPEVPLPFPAKLDKGETDRAFTVTVKAGGAGTDAVRESVRHPATGYCLLNFGGSDVAWTTGSDGEWLAARGEDGSLTYSGRCINR